MRVMANPPPPGSGHVLAIEWDGQPKPKHVAEYRQWILSTHQMLCDRWQVSILYCLGVAPNRTELWEFKPGNPPKLAETINAEIP